MAILLSEDEQVKSSFELLFLKDQIKNKPSVSWINYKLVLISGENKIVYERKENNKGAGDYVLALKPVNEIENIVSGINSFLKNESSKMFSFEPLEPSFEFILERSHKGYSVTCWLDAGNVISDHYSWDGFGIRFFTNEEKIVSFMEQVSQEMRDLGVIGKM